MRILPMTQSFYPKDQVELFYTVSLLKNT